MGKQKKERKQLVYALRTTHQLIKAIITWIKIFYCKGQSQGH